MAFVIDARLEHGTPALTLIDAATGEERLHWQADHAGAGERAWQSLFKNLMLLSCADRMGLFQRSKSTTFAGECLVCNSCSEQAFESGGYPELSSARQSEGILIFLQERRNK